MATARVVPHDRRGGGDFLTQRLEFQPQLPSLINLLGDTADEIELVFRALCTLELILVFGCDIDLALPDFAGMCLNDQLPQRTRIRVRQG
jgi:hypothetical protein